MLEHSNKRRHQRLRKRRWKIPEKYRIHSPQEFGLERLRSLVLGIVQSGRLCSSTFQLKVLFFHLGSSKICMLDTE